MAVLLRVLAGLAGLALVLAVLDAAIRTFLLPRSASVRLSRSIAWALRRLFDVLAPKRLDYVTQDRVLSLYPSVLLLTYQAVWLSLTLAGFTGLFYAAGAASLARSTELAGSSLFTLGTSAPTGAAQLACTYIAAAVGLTLLALLIAFIPTLYTAFGRREATVSRLAVRAGVPSTPWGVIEIAESVSDPERLDELWAEWETWFIELGETHTTLVILNYYRSPTASVSWIGSAGVVLDAAALYNAAVDRPPSASAGLCIRAGWLSLRLLADHFRLPYPELPSRTDPISVTRAEFDAALDHLSRSGVPILADREAAWWDFVGWRANYDAILEACYGLFSAPRPDWHLADTAAPTPPSNRRGGA